MQGRNSSLDGSFSSNRGSGNGPSRTKSAVRWAVEDEAPERQNSNSGSSFDRLQLSNQSSLHGVDRNNGNSLTVGMGHSTNATSNTAASNPQAKINRNRTLSKTFSTLELQFKLQQQDKYDTLTYKIGKSLFAIFVLVITTGAMLLSKASLVYLADKGNTSDKDLYKEYIVQILCVILIPLVLTAGSDCLYWWVRETKEKKKDPKAIYVRPHAIMLLALLEGIIEAAGNAIFICLVLPAEGIDNFTRVFLLNGLCVIPVICGMVMKWKKWLKPAAKANPHNDGTDMELRDMEHGSIRESGSKKSSGGDFCSRIVVTGVQMLFLAMQLGGMGLFMYKYKLYWEIPVALILSSVSWWKNFVFIDRLETHWAEAFKRNRYASSFVKTLSKIAFIMITVIIILKVKFDLNADDYLHYDFFYDSIKYAPGMYFALVGGFVAYYVVWLSCLACMQVFCAAIPVLLVTPLSLFYQSWDCHNYIFGESKIGNCDTFFYSPLKDGMIIAAGVLLWVSFIIMSGHLWQGIDKRDANQLEEDMWTQPEGYHCIFIEQSIALNRNRNPKVVKSLDGEVEYGYHAHRTYITTTMYHESKTEMQKLVMSLLQIDAEIPTEDKVADYYEAHIIFDDAFLKQPNPKPDHFDYSPFYNQWVFYLMDIFAELKLKRLGDAVVVWYGEVLTFKFSLGMKLVVHLKDVSKIRQKKRWSQILYMHCILEDVLDNENKLGMLDSNTFILMIDGDTQFSRKSVNMMRHMIELDRERSGAVCGRIFPEGSSNPVVWYQKFEYAVGHWFQKTAEHVFGTVLCSPGCFSLVRIAALYRRSGEDMDGENCAIETYSVEVNSAMDVLKFDQGEDRMLSTLIIKNGWRLQYCAGAEAGTFCPEGFGDFFKQRRRWISSTLANLYFLIASSSDIIKTNTSVSPPFVLYTAGVFASSIFGPATIILVVVGGVGYAFNWNGITAILIGLGFPVAYALLCIVFNLDMESDTPRKKSKKIDIQVGGAFLLCALYALLMAAVAVGITAQIVGEPDGVSAIYLYTLIMTMVITALLHGEFWLLVYGVVYLFLLPTMYLILIMFAVANIHDQSWGTRDSSSGSKETDADRFFSITKVAVYIRDLRKSFREALADERPNQPTKEDMEDKWRNPNYWKKAIEDDGKEEMVFLEEERRKLEEERKKQEEEKKKAEEERKLREIERQKEEAKKKKLEAEERERLQEKLKQERRRGINHPYKDHLSALSRRLKSKVAAPEKGNDKDIAAQKLEQIRALATLQQLSCFMLFLVTVIWLILVLTVSIHPELKFLETNAVGILFLISFGIISILQFFASIAHRLETMFNALAQIPMTVDCALVDRGRKYERMMALKQQAETGEPIAKERVAAKVARKLLMVDKRTATKANLFSG